MIQCLDFLEGTEAFCGYVCTHTYIIMLHTTAPLKDVGICTAREQHTIAQTCKLECTKILLTEVIS